MKKKNIFCLFVFTFIFDLSIILIAYSRSVPRNFERCTIAKFPSPIFLPSSYLSVTTDDEVCCKKKKEIAKLRKYQLFILLKQMNVF